MKIGILGSSGAVGKELIQLIEAKESFVNELRLFDSKNPPSYDGLDVLFSCVSSEIAKDILPSILGGNLICIDASSAFRKENDVPLVIPEINAHALKEHNGLIASPNCTTTIMLLPLAPLHRHFQIKRIVAATYQAVSGAGAKAIQELEEQSRAHLEKRKTKPKIFPFPCAFNVFPHESSLLDSGYVEEEEKMIFETKKILNDSSVAVSARCVRVPVFRSHSMALNVEFHQDFSLEEVHSILQETPGISLKKSAAAIDTSKQNTVLCTSVRRDLSQPNTLEMWVVGDQLLKGAALNMLQIAEILSPNLVTG